MPKKNMENLRQAHDAVDRFIKLIDQDPGNNDIFSETVMMTLLELLKKEHQEVQKILEPTRKVSTVKPKLHEN